MAGTIGTGTGRMKRTITIFSENPNNETYGEQEVREDKCDEEGDEKK